MLGRSSCCSEFLSSIFSGWYPEKDPSSECPQPSTSSGTDALTPEVAETAAYPSTSSGVDIHAAEVADIAAGPSTSSGIDIHAPRICDSLYELYRPEGTPSMQILFFHGLLLSEHKDAHLLTWQSGDGKCLWPQTWLVEKFPTAHVLCVSYSGDVMKRSQDDQNTLDIKKESEKRAMDMYVIGENLISDLLRADIGQERSCPVILVGHCFGGLVIKEVCHRADVTKKGINRVKLQKFLDSIKGIFYYATPHHGTNVEADLEGSPLLKYFKVLSKRTSRLNMEFDELRKNGNWSIRGLGETLPTQWGTFNNVLVVTEGSARVADFNMVENTDHFSICKPQSKISRSFYQLMDFLSDITKGKANPDNLQHLPDSIVGIQTAVQDVKDKLVSKTPIGLVGMGGLGKTTLAKAVFNNLNQEFEYSCFVPNVKDIKGEVNVVKKEVWTQLCCRGEKVTSGLDWIERELRGKKLLLVLDDIRDDRDGTVLSEIVKLQVDPESRFIVTSRDKSLVKYWEGDIYDVQFLNEVTALELFKSYAVPPQTLEPITESIVKKCDGLPLTIEVLGKYLKGRDIGEWKEALDILDKAEDVGDMNVRIWAKLRISYKALGRTEKQIFLDATTFFSGNKNWTLREAQEAWRVAHETSAPKLCWRTLVDRSLVYHVKENDSIKVHEQLQSLGRKIASEPENIDKLREWDGKKGSQVLQSIQRSKGKEFYSLRVKSLRPSPSLIGEIDDIRIPSIALRSLKKSHFLEFHDRVITDGTRDDGSFPTELVLFRCVGQTLFDPSLQSRLAVLEVSHLEYIPDSIGQLSCLSCLKITNSKKLCSLPESFGKLSSLKDLELLNCSSLRALPDSFGELRALESLALRHLPFPSLPESFGDLSSLKDLELLYCTSLRALPDSFGQLKALERLAFMYVFFQSLPENFGDLSSLNHLTLQFCPSLSQLPESFHRLCSLNHLAFVGCSGMETLPESFGRLASLKFLRFKKSSINSLPKSFGELKALDRFEFDTGGGENLLPDSFGQLTALRYLLLTCCAVPSLPESFGQLKALEHLVLESCIRLNNLPESFGALKALRYLQITECPIKGLPESFCQLSGLNHLMLCCSKVDTLSDSFGQLTGLQSLMIDVYAERIPSSLGDLKDLLSLKIRLHSAASIPDTIKSLPSLKTLEISFDSNFDTVLPPWLAEPNALGDSKSYSILEFKVKDGRFLVTHSSLRGIY